MELCMQTYLMILLLPLRPIVPAGMHFKDCLTQIPELESFQCFDKRPCWQLQYAAKHFRLLGIDSTSFLQILFIYFHLSDLLQGIVNKLFPKVEVIIG